MKMHLIFTTCGNEDCPRVTFEDALEGMFKCPSCGKVLNLKKNDKSKKAYQKKIDEIKKDMQQSSNLNFNILNFNLLE